MLLKLGQISLDYRNSRRQEIRIPTFEKENKFQEMRFVNESVLRIRNARTFSSNSMGGGGGGGVFRIDHLRRAGFRNLGDPMGLARDGKMVSVQSECQRLGEGES